MPVAPWQWCSRSYKFAECGLTADFSSFSLLPRVSVFLCLSMFLSHFYGDDCFGPASGYIWMEYPRIIDLCIPEYYPFFCLVITASFNRLLYSCHHYFVYEIPDHCRNFWSSVDAFRCSRFFSFAWMTVYAELQADAINTNKRKFPPPGPFPCRNLTPLRTRLLLSCWN